MGKFCRILLFSFAAVCLIIGTLFLVGFLQRSGFTYNSEGSYFDSVAGVVYHRQSVIVYGLFTLTAYIIAVVFVFLGLSIKGKAKI